MKYECEAFDCAGGLPEHGLLLLRHGPRAGGQFPQAHVPLSQDGEKFVHGVGKRWKSDEKPSRLYSSPLQRCIHTAETLSSSCDWDVEVMESTLLGGHGAFVIDSKALGTQLTKLSEQDGRALFIAHMRGEDVDGMRPVEQGSRMILEALCPKNDFELHIAISHETVIAAVGAYLGGDPSDWPNPMCGIHVRACDAS